MAERSGNDMRKQSVLINKIDFLFIFSIIFLVLMDCNFFYLFATPASMTRYWGTYAKFLLVIISVLVFIWSKGWKNTENFLKKYFIGLVFSFVVISISSVFRYDGEHIYNHVFLYGGVFLSIMAFPMIKLFNRQEGYEKLLTVLNFWAFIVYSLFIIQAFLYSNTGQMVLNIEYRQRSESLRMALPCIANVMVLYNFCRVFCSKEEKKLFNIIQLIMGLYCVFVIQQTRAYYIVLCISFVVVLIFASEDKTKTVRNILIIAVVVGIVIYLEIFEQFLDTFSEKSSEAAGNIARSGAFAYFWSEFLRTPIFGHGFLTTQSNLTIRTGTGHIFYYADTGIVGVMAQIGIFVIPVYIWPVIHWGKIVLKNIKMLDPFLVGLFVYILTTSPTLICTNPERCILMPLVLALFAYSDS